MTTPKTHGVCVCLVAMVLFLGGCSLQNAPATESPDTDTRPSAADDLTSSTGPPAISKPAGQVDAQGVDPQVLSDVIAGVFIVPDESVLRGLRVRLATDSMVSVACGGTAHRTIEGTGERVDQARYAYLPLIAEKFLSEPLDDNPRPTGFDQECSRTLLPSEEAWHSLTSGSWVEATATAQQSPAVVSTFPGVAACLREKTGFDVDETDPTASFLAESDYAGSASDSANDWQQVQELSSQAYVACTGPYFDAMLAELKPKQAELTERNRELLEQYARELVALGYVP